MEEYLHHLGHGWPAGRQLRRAHECQLKQRQHLLFLLVTKSHPLVHTVEHIPPLHHSLHLLRQHHNPPLLIILHRSPTRHHLQHHHPKPVHVTLVIHPQAPAPHLGGHVPLAPHSPGPTHQPR
ncbi:DNA-directed RNA polymerase subunit beta' [Striga asiatica]|uniref:DNA-directed RNA polymerase subunit beta n=1 Tax=Striga asiatica TaxID=4170 RepID=A0A5A7PLM4_STRAF|nr:DNA-directed RNA polymerase subunit beta' [Striga asiatica]